MKIIIALCLGILMLGMICAVPASADVPTNIVDQYWVWYPTFQAPSFVAAPGHWVGYINKIGVDAPDWGPNFDTLDIFNVYQPNNVKNIWVEVKYLHQQTEIAKLQVTDPNGVSYDPVKSWISQNGQFVTWQWQLPWQPSMETVSFGSTDFYNLKDIELVELGTQCVPEPGTLLVLASGLMGLAGFGLKMRKK